MNTNVEIDLRFSLLKEVMIHAHGVFSQGNRVWLSAPSGFGKTTLLRVIAGVTESAVAVEGRVLLGQNDLLHLPAHARGIGWVPQGDSLFPGFSVEDQLRLPLRWKKVAYQAREDWIRDQVDRFELRAFLKTPVEKLSGGEKSRVAMARAMTPDVRLILMDEPFAALDHSARERVEKILVNNFSGPCTPVLVIASHDPPISQNFFTTLWQGAVRHESQKRRSEKGVSEKDRSVREFSIVSRGIGD